MSRIPETLDGWYILGNRIIEFMCQQVNCGNEPTEEVCKHCLLYTLSKNLKFHYELGTHDYMIKMIYYWKGFYKDLIKKAIECLKEKKKLV